MKRFMAYMIIGFVGLTIGFFVHKLLPPVSSTAPATTPGDKSVPPDILSAYLRIYSIDIEFDREIIRLYVQPPRYLNIRQQLEYLAGVICRAEFDGLPIEIMDIENRSGLNIVKVNLKEIGDVRSPSWRYYYFQGSGIGLSTTHILKESFLQRDYMGEWIDGVEFYYEGRPLREWDHVLLDELFLRSPK